MKVCKDNEGRNWTIAMSAASAMRVQESVTITVPREMEKPDGTKVVETLTVPFDIADISRITETLNVLRNSFLPAAKTIWAIVQPQADEKGITRESFLEALTGDPLQAMSAALADELIEFFPPVHRPMLRDLRSKLDAVADSLIATAQEQIQNIDTEKAVAAATAAAAQTAR